MYVPEDRELSENMLEVVNALSSRYHQILTQARMEDPDNYMVEVEAQMRRLANAYTINGTLAATTVQHMGGRTVKITLHEYGGGAHAFDLG